MAAFGDAPPFTSPLACKGAFDSMPRVSSALWAAAAAVVCAGCRVAFAIWTAQQASPPGQDAPAVVLEELV